MPARVGARGEVRRRKPSDVGTRTGGYGTIPGLPFEVRLWFGARKAPGTGQNTTENGRVLTSGNEQLSGTATDQRREHLGYGSVCEPQNEKHYRAGSRTAAVAGGRRRRSRRPTTKRAGTVERPGGVKLLGLRVGSRTAGCGRCRA